MDGDMRNLERAAAMGDTTAEARLTVVRERGRRVRFMAHFVTDGTLKARVTYSAGQCYVPGTKWVEGVGRPTEATVTIYAKRYEDGNLLARIFAGLYENNTDSQTDYFEKGRVKLTQAHPLYAVALKRSQDNDAAWNVHRAKVAAKREARRADRARLGTFDAMGRLG